MTPFYFGSPDRRLYGVYHAGSTTGTPRAAVLCYPWGPEYGEAHRAIRQLAVTLVGAGIHVLRFDYFGTGDSGGDHIDGDFDGWVEDTLWAVDELHDISGARSIVLVGLRFGALIAAAAAIRRPQTVESLLLWDPLVSGDYLDELRRTAWSQNMYPVFSGGPGEGCEIFGFPIGPALLKTFRLLDLRAITIGVKVPLLLVHSGDRPELTEAVNALGRDRIQTIVHVSARSCWVNDGVRPSSFVPVTVLGAIRSALT